MRWAILLAALFLWGCSGSVRAKTGADGKGEIEGEVEAEGGAEGAKQPSGGAGKGGQGGAVATPPPSGRPIATFPGFDVLPDGRSVITVQVRGPIEVSEQKAEGRLIYVLKGVSVPEKVNRLPLLTQHFPTQVTSVSLEQTAAGAQLVVDLREPSNAAHKVSDHEGGSILTITLPRSEKYGRVSGTAVDPGDDPTNWERPDGTPDGDTTQGDDDTIDSQGSDVPEDASEETERRRRKSKRQPRPYVMRPLTLPRATLAPDIGLSFGGRGRFNAFTFLTSGLRIGVADFFEIEATPHSFRLAPGSPAYAFPSLGLTAGYTGHVFEIAGRVRYFFGIDTGSTDEFGPGGMVLGVPMAIHMGKWGRIDTGGFVTMDFDGDRTVTSAGPGDDGIRVGLFEQQPSPFYVDSGVPLKFLFNPIEELWFGIHHGIAIYDFSAAGDTFALPLGGEIGVTASDDYNPIADFGVKLDFPEFIVPADDADVLHEDTYELGFWFRWFYHL